MEKLRRKYLKNTGERIQFGATKGSVVERYFKKPDSSRENDLYLYINYREIPIPKNIEITFIYLDENYTEFVVKEELTFQEAPPFHKGEIVTRVPFFIQKDGKELFKIKFENLPTTESSLHLTVSPL